MKNYGRTDTQTIITVQTDDDGNPRLDTIQPPLADGALLLPLEKLPQPSYDLKTQKPEPFLTWLTDKVVRDWTVRDLTPAEIAAARAAQYPSATPRQVRIWLLRHGVTAQQVEAQIASIITDPTAQAEALIAFEYSTGIDRDNPLTVALAGALGFTATGLDAEWASILAL